MVGVQAGSTGKNFTLQSKGIGSALEFTLAFKADSSVTRIRSQSYLLHTVISILDSRQLKLHNLDFRGKSVEMTRHRKVEIRNAIRDMVVHGAPAIAIAATLSLVRGAPCFQMLMLSLKISYQILLLRTLKGVWLFRDLIFGYEHGGKPAVNLTEIAPVQADEVDLLGDFIDAPTSLMPKPCTYNTSYEVDLFKDAVFVSATPHVDSGVSSQVQENVDLFALKPSSTSASSSPIIDFFTTRKPVSQAKAKTPGDESIDSETVIPFQECS